MAYAPDLWRWFGLTLITVWEISDLEFSSLTHYIDQRRRAEQEANRGEH